MKWDENDISVCKFPFSCAPCNALTTSESCHIGSFFRAAIPKDIIAGRPNPSQWGLPSASLRNTTCNIGRYFSNHSIVFGALLVRYDRYHLVCTYTPHLDISFCGQLLNYQTLKRTPDPYLGDLGGTSYATSRCPGSCDERLMLGANFVVCSKSPTISSSLFYLWGHSLECDLEHQFSKSLQEATHFRLHFVCVTK